MDCGSTSGSSGRLVAISLYWIPGLVGLREASLAYRYAAGRHAAKLDQTRPIPAIIATIVFFYILLVLGMASDKLPSTIQWAKHLSFSIATTPPRTAVD